MSYIRQPNPAGFYYKPEVLEHIDVYVEDDFDKQVRYVVMSVANYDKLHGLSGEHADHTDVDYCRVELRSKSNPERTWLVRNDDPTGTGNHYIDPALLASEQFVRQQYRFVTHLYAIPPFPA